MIKQLLLTITGEFNPIEFKNIVSDRTDTFNFQYKALKTPNVRYSVKMRAEDTIAILLEGDEEEVRTLGESIKRGPLTSHIASIEELWREGQEAPKVQPIQSRPPQPSVQSRLPTKKRRRRRKRPLSDAI